MAFVLGVKLEIPMKIIAFASEFETLEVEPQ